MNALSRYVDRRRDRFRRSWPGLRAFWPSLPIGMVAGVLLYALLRSVWPEPLVQIQALFVTVAVFCLIDVFREVPEAREFPGTAVLAVLAVSAAGAELAVLVGVTVASVADFVRLMT